MNAPRRYLDAEASLARTLLRSAEQDAPTKHSWRRALAATALAAATSTTAQSAAAGTVGVGLVMKWLAIGAVAGGIVALGGSTLLDAGSSTPPRAVTTPAPVRVTPPARTRPSPSAGRAAAPGPSPTRNAPLAVSTRPRAVARAAPPATADTLARQLAYMDSTRKKLAAGDAAGAISELDEYRARFSKPSFGQEAALLRAEALVLEGNCAAALALAPESSSVFARRWQQLKARCR